MVRVLCIEANILCCHLNTKSQSDKNIQIGEIKNTIKLSFYLICGRIQS